MDPPIEGVDGGSDPPLAYDLRAPPRAADPAEDMQTMQREPGDAQPRDERPADAYLTGSGIAAPAAPEPLDTTSTKLDEPPEVNTGNSRRSSSPSESGPASAAPRDKLTSNTTEQLLAQAARTLARRDLEACGCLDGRKCSTFLGSLAVYRKGG